MRLECARVVFISAVLALFPVGCGKYGPPLPPEALSPRGVESLLVSPSIEGLKFQWTAPSADQRGKDLRSMDGYRIYRSEGGNGAGAALAETKRYVLLSELEDRHIVDLQNRRKQAEQNHKPGQRLKADPALMKFEYWDKSVTRGSRYFYKIVPVNQGGIEGQVRQVIRVNFNAENSDIVTIPLSAELNALGDEEQE